MIDYDSLKLIWWFFIVVLFLGFALTDGFDLGMAILLPWVAKTNGERRAVINTVGATWEGSQVWFITAGGATFAAWPLVYSAGFSGLYTALMLTLFALILRPPAFDYRSKIPNPVWQNSWDWVLFTSGLVPTLVLGVAVGNLLQGLPFFIEADFRSFYTGNLWQLFSPFALLCGVLSICMIMMHGGAFLLTKTTDQVYQRTIRFTKVCAMLSIVLFILGGIWISHSIVGYKITDIPNVAGVVTPLQKTVIAKPGLWMANFQAHPQLWLIPTLGVLGAVIVSIFAGRGFDKSVFVGSGISVAGIISTPAVAMFPFVMPSKTVPQSSLTIWDAASSQMTLQIMLIVTVIFLPIILLYTAWVYRVMRGRYDASSIEQNPTKFY